MTASARTALVTGAAGGIGMVCVQRFIQQGQRVVMVDRDAEALAAAAATLPPEQVLAIPCDLSYRSSASQIDDRIREHKFGPVSILVNNAGIAPKHGGRHHNILEIDLAEWDLVLEVNLSAAMLLARQFLPAMRDQGFGRIINISSVAARGRSAISGPAYMASKAGLLGLTRHIAGQFAKHGITANAVAPSRVTTNMASAIDPNLAATYIKNNPAGREGTADEIAAVVAFIASDDAGYCNGAVFDVNGGMLMC